jgi:hypothetical protein
VPFSSAVTIGRGKFYFKRPTMPEFQRLAVLVCWQRLEEI